jgi:P-type Ca2+ transporter type 2C
VTLLLTTVCLAVAVTGRAAGTPWQSQLMVTLTAGQLGVALALRPRGAWHRSGGRSAWVLPLSVVGSFLLLLAAVYVPALTTILRTEPLTPVELAGAVAAGLVPGMLLWAARAVGRISGTLRERPG